MSDYLLLSLMMTVLNGDGEETVWALGHIKEICSPSHSRKEKAAAQQLASREMRERNS